MAAEPIGWFLKSPSETRIHVKGKPAPEDLVRADEPEEGDFLLCRQCEGKIVRSTDRIAVEGSHCHTFANPHGIVFEIGCFSSAPGCGAAGPGTDEFSWFTGHQWKIAFCRRCRIHLGWQFASDSGGQFFGLILDRLIESVKSHNSPS